MTISKNIPAFKKADPDKTFQPKKPEYFVSYCATCENPYMFNSLTPSDLCRRCREVDISKRVTRLQHANQV